MKVFNNLLDTDEDLTSSSTNNESIRLHPRSTLVCIVTSMNTVMRVISIEPDNDTEMG